jgi:CTP-dependent riboflavin kinase
LFFHLVTFANFKDEEFLGKVIKRGQIAKSLSTLSSETGLTVNEIRTAIKHLELTKEITSVSQGKYTLFTVTNYDLYQTESQAFNNDLTTESQPINNRLTTNKEYKNKRTKELEKEKNIKKKETYDSILDSVEDEGLREMYREYIKMRALIKAPMTDKALTILISKVNRLESSVERQMLLLETAITNNWKSVYPLKDGDTPKQTGERKGYGGTYV